MSNANPLQGLPAAGVFPLEFSPAFTSALGAKPDEKPEELIGLKYAFKPASITPDTEGVLETKKGKPSKLSFDTQKGSQVFDIREEPPAPRECVIIWNPETASFTVHPLATSLNLTLNRNLSGQPSAPASAAAPAPAKDAVKPKRKADPTSKESPKKKSRPSLPDVRPKTGGKTLPPPGARKSLPKPPAVDGKFKSSEIIEESDVEDEEEAEGEGEGEDDFAALLGAEMAREDDEDGDDGGLPAVNAGALPGNVRVAAEYYDDSTESEESEDEF